MPTTNFRLDVGQRWSRCQRPRLCQVDVNHTVLRRIIGLAYARVVAKELRSRGSLRTGIVRAVGLVVPGRHDVARVQRALRPALSAVRREPRLRRSLATTRVSTKAIYPTEDGVIHINVTPPGALAFETRRYPHREGS